MSLITTVTTLHTNRLTIFKKMVKNRSVSQNTVVFNNLVNTKAEYLEDWEVPLKDSWHGRFLA